MLPKFTFVVALVALAINQAKGSCDISESLIAHAWMYKYEGAAYDRLNLRFTNTTVMKYKNNDLQETFECISTDQAAPLQMFLVESVSTTPRKKYCFQLAGFNTGPNPVAFGFREYDGTNQNSGSDCLKVFEFNNPGYSENLQITVRYDPNNVNVNGGYDFALNNGECAGTFPLAYTATTDPKDPDILQTKELSAVIKTGEAPTPDEYKCAGSAGSKCTRSADSNVVNCELCDIGKSTGYGYPINGISGRWRCLGNMLSNAVGLVGAHFQIFAIQQSTTRWHFACVRHAEVAAPTDPSAPRCLEFSMDLTDDMAAVCRIKNDDGTDVTVTQASRTAEPNGYLAFRLCAEDCKNNECKNEVNGQCVQKRDSFECGTCQTNYQGYLCEEEKKECASSPCQNGGQCFELINQEGFECTCRTGFKGTLCEISTCEISDTWRGINYFYKYKGPAVNKAQIDTVLFEDSRFVTIGADRYDCERETESGGIFTFTMLKEGSTNERLCVEVIPLSPVTATKRSYHLIRLKAKPGAAAIVDPGTCGFASTEKHNVLVHPDVVYGNTLPVAPGTYQVEANFGGSECGENDPNSQATLPTGSNTMNFGATCPPTANTLLPTGKTVSVMTYWDATVMGDPNAAANGGVMLIAIDNLVAGDDGPTYYCARYRQDTPQTPTITMSFNINNQLAPECLPNAKSQDSTNNHVYVKLTSNRCHILGNPCSPGTCTDTPNQSYQCTCPAGYIFRNGKCEEINECDAQPCFAAGTVKCVDGTNKFTCECKNGWTGDLCEIEDVCYNHGCLNGATCVPDAVDTRKYVCTCVRGWENGPLRTCENDVDECLSNPCQNKGTCHQDKLVGGQRQTELDYFECECAPGFSGTFCEQVQNNCNPNPCKNGGTCVNYPDKVANPPGWYCRCPEAYIWQTCEHPHECFVKNPCDPVNTLKCEDRLGEAVCYCKEGFLGGDINGRYNGNCSQPDTSNPCYSSPCKNNGICQPNGERFTCDCLPQFKGLTCLEPQLSCADDPCQLREICTPTTDRNATAPYVCTCPAGVVCGEDDGFGVVEQALVGLLCALVIGCIILGIWAICANKCGPCGKAGCCP